MNVGDRKKTETQVASMRLYEDIESFLCDSIGFFAIEPSIDFAKIDTKGFSFSMFDNL